MPESKQQPQRGAGADPAPTREQFEALQRENEQLKSQLTEARGAQNPSRVTFAASPPFKLSEGDRQALEINGVATDTFTGKQLLADDFGIDVKTDEGKAALERARQARGKSGDDPVHSAAGIEGVTHVYPSVAPGVLAKDAPVRGAVPEGTQER